MHPNSCTALRRQCSRMLVRGCVRASHQVPLRIARVRAAAMATEGRAHRQVLLLPPSFKPAQILLTSSPYPAHIPAHAKCAGLCGSV